MGSFFTATTLVQAPPEPDIIGGSDVLYEYLCKKKMVRNGMTVLIGVKLIISFFNVCVCVVARAHSVERARPCPSCHWHGHYWFHICHQPWSIGVRAASCILPSSRNRVLYNTWYRITCSSCFFVCSYGVSPFFLWLWLCMQTCQHSFFCETSRFWTQSWSLAWHVVQISEYHVN